MTPLARSLLLAMAIGSAPGVALGQSSGGASALPKPPPLDAPAPYDRQLARLAEILGALTWLTELCGQDDAQRTGEEWRQRMSDLLNAEAETQSRRERLAGAYNRGLRSYEAIYRSCTPNAELVIARYLDEGGRLAREIANRYGG